MSIGMLNQERCITLIKFIEYMKIHLMSVEQDIQQVSEEMEKLDENSKDYKELEFEFNWLGGQRIATAHLLSVASDMLNPETGEK